MRTYTKTYEYWPDDIEEPTYHEVTYEVTAIHRPVGEPGWGGDIYVVSVEPPLPPEVNIAEWLERNHDFGEDYA